MGLYPAGFLRTPSLFPPITPYPHIAKLPNCRCVRTRLIYTAPHLPRTRGNCGKPVSVQTIILYFSNSSMPAINESEKLASRSMADVQVVSARLSGHPSKYWLRPALPDFGDVRSRAPTAHLPLSVNYLFIYLFIEIYSKILRTSLSSIKLNTKSFRRRYRRENNVKYWKSNYFILRYKLEINCIKTW